MAAPSAGRQNHAPPRASRILARQRSRSRGRNECSRCASRRTQDRARPAQPCRAWAQCYSFRPYCRAARRDGWISLRGQPARSGAKQARCGAVDRVDRIARAPAWRNAGRHRRAAVHPPSSRCGMLQSAPASGSRVASAVGQAGGHASHSPSSSAVGIITQPAGPPGRSAASSGRAGGGVNRASGATPSAAPQRVARVQGRRCDADRRQRVLRGTPDRREKSRPRRALRPGAMPTKRCRTAAAHARWCRRGGGSGAHARPRR